ncbi:MAG: hypothetical protein CMJ32_07955 [Phycisphaerae bacterium]|nr:hypothetical protein [Phycisphaerae bacterium]
MSRWLKTGYHTQWVGAGNSYSVLYQVRDTERYTFKPISNFLESMPLDRDPTDEGIPYPKTVWWNIEVWGFTQFFEATAGAPTTIQPRYNGPQNSWQSGNIDATRTSPLRFRLRYQNESQRNRYVDIDVGAGIKLAICSDQCVVEGLVPEGSLSLNDGTPAVDTFTIPAGTTYAQSLIAGTISMQDAPVGDRFATLTERLFAAPGDANSIATTVKIPPAAKKVTILQGAAGTPGVFDFKQWADNTLGLTLGQVAVNPATRVSPKVEIPGQASYITLANPDPGVARQWALVFSLEF